jgi:hypothetical protein
MSSLQKYGLSNMYKGTPGVIPYTAPSQLISGEIDVAGFTGQGLSVALEGGDGTTQVTLEQEADFGDGQGFIFLQSQPWWVIGVGTTSFIGSAISNPPTFAVADKIRWRAKLTAGLAPTGYRVVPACIFQVGGRG